MNKLKLIFKSFYDLNYTNDYIKNGKGVGNSLLAIIALIMVISFATKIALPLLPYANNEKLETSIRYAFSRLPKIEIIDGKLNWEDNVKERFVLDNGIYMTIDTQNDDPTIRDIQGSVIYLTKYKLYVYSPQNGNLRDVSFQDLQSTTGNNPLDLTSVEIQNFIIKFVKILIWISIISVLVFGFFACWIGNVILTAFTRSISSSFSKTLAKREFFEIRRMATISTVPVILSFDLIQIFLYAPQFWVKWVAILVIGTIVMLKHDSFEETGDSSESTKTNN